MNQYEPILDPIENQKRLRTHQVMDRLSVSQSGLAKMIQMSQGYVSHIVSGKKPITKKFVRSMREFCGVSVDWLISGEGEMFERSPAMPGGLTENSAPSAIADNQISGSYKHSGSLAPLVTIPQHGVPLSSWDEALQTSELTRLPSYVTAEVDVIFRFTGFSMFPRLKPDALLFASELPEVMCLPSGTEHIYILLYRNVLKAGFLNNHSALDQHLTLYFADDKRNAPERIPADQVSKVWFCSLVLQVP